MSFANYLENELMDHVFGRSWTAPSTIFVGLSSTDPTEDGSGITEVISANNGYARIPTTGADWTVASDGAIANSADLSFSSANSAWGIQSWVFLADQGSAGNYLGSNTLTSSKDIQQGDTPKFSAPNLLITLD